MAYFFNNSFCNEIKLDIEDLGILRGFAAFEYLRTYNMQPFCLKAHLYRFFYSMQQLGITCSYTLEKLEDITLKLIQLHGSDCGVKWYATGGKSKDGLHFENKPQFFAFTISITETPKKLYEEGIITETFFEKRPFPESKTTAYLAPSVKLSLNPHLGEVIYVDHNKNLLEAATSNLFFVKNQILYTAAHNVLYGITREVVLELAKNEFKCVQEPVNYADINSFDEAFVTATNKQIMPIQKIDNISFKVGNTTQRLMQKFEEFKKQTLQNECIPPVYIDCITQTVDAL